MVVVCLTTAKESWNSYSAKSPGLWLYCFVPFIQLRWHWDPALAAVNNPEFLFFRTPGFDGIQDKVEKCGWSKVLTFCTAGVTWEWSDRLQDCWNATLCFYSTLWVWLGYFETMLMQSCKLHPSPRHHSHPFQLCPSGTCKPRASTGKKSVGHATVSR